MIGTFSFSEIHFGKPSEVQTTFEQLKSVFEISNTTTLSRFDNGTASTSSKAMHKCDECGRNYLHSSSLMRHKLTHRGGGKHYMCPICDSKFTQKSSMKTHMRNVHQSLLCPVCAQCVPVDNPYIHHSDGCPMITMNSTTNSTPDSFKPGDSVFDIPFLHDV